VIVPYVYQELLMLSARAFDEALGRGHDKGWQLLAGGGAEAGAAMPPAMRRLFARLLTDHAFHAAEPGDNSTDTLRLNSRVQASAIGNLSSRLSTLRTRCCLPGTAFRTASDT
jgi:hypothetical protein